MRNPRNDLRQNGCGTNSEFIKLSDSYFHLLITLEIISKFFRPEFWDFVNNERANELANQSARKCLLHIKATYTLKIPLSRRSSNLLGHVVFRVLFPTCDTAISRFIFNFIFLTADSIRLWNILWTFLLRVTRPCCVFMKWTEATHELHARKVRDSAKTPTLLAIFFRSKDTLLSWNVKGLFSGCFTKISKLKQFQAWTLKKCPVEELLALNSLNVDIFCLPLSVQIPAWFYQSSTIEVLAHAMPIAILFVYN